jgi:phosphonopyruvate decarboxylase
MIDSKNFFAALQARGVGFYAGVPDSLLANFCAYVDDVGGRDQHLITANEGNAIALAIGFHLATGQLAAVYMQNSGLGNAVNPLTSLADPEVYRVPMLLVIGWRGEPGVTDEPQHIKQGRVTLDQLDVLEIPHWTLDGASDVDATLDQAFASMRDRSAPVALVVRKDTFAKYTPNRHRGEVSTLARETALDQILRLCAADDLIIATTGKTSREVFELRQAKGQAQRDFLTVGGMGHASSIALGVAIGQPGRRVVCLDGDGAALMHLGSLAVIADYKPERFIHVLLNNGSHESVGGQRTSATQVDFAQLAPAVGYHGYAVAQDIDSLREAWQTVVACRGPVLLEVKIKTGSRADLGRPTVSAEKGKITFMEAVGV